MKRVFIMLAIVGSAGLLFAQKSNQKEVKQLQKFFAANQLRRCQLYSFGNYRH